MRYALDVARSSPEGWRSSTGATCPTRTSQRNSSSRLRSCMAGLPGLQRAGRGILRGRGVVVGIRPRAGDGPAARRTSVVRPGRQALDQPVRDRTVSDIVALAPTRVDPAELPFPAPPVRAWPFACRRESRTRSAAFASTGKRGWWVRTAFRRGRRLGGISTGGYASGLAAALSSDESARRVP